MSYSRKVIGSNERLVLVTGLHWIYLVEAALGGGIIIAIGAAIDSFLKNYMGYNSTGYDVNLYFIQIGPAFTQISFIFTIIGVIVFFVLGLKYFSSEIGLTDRRIIYKTGLIKIDVQQVELEDIRGEAVHHGWLGWILGYGRIHFDCRFIDDIFLPATRNPYRLVKAVHTARMRSERIPAYSEKELDFDVARLNQQRVEAFKVREKIKRMGAITRRDFDKAKGKSTT